LSSNLVVPDGRVGHRQRACSAPTCQTARRARTQASWRRRNPNCFIAHRMQRRRLEAEEAKGAVLPLVLPPPLSQLPWDVALEAFGLTGADFLSHLGRVLLVAERSPIPDNRAWRHVVQVNAFFEEFLEQSGRMVVHASLPTLRLR
jgi:hypothetical protein